MKEFELSSIDDIDIKILRILSEDGRETFNKMGSELKKSPVTIKKHVENLEKRGIIKGYGAQIDFEKLGYNIIAIIEVTVSKGKMLDVEKEIGNNPNVFAVYDITGTYDALILARFKSRKKLSETIKLIHTSPNVEHTNTHLILNIIKEESSFVKLMEKESKK